MLPLFSGAAGRRRARSPMRMKSRSSRRAYAMYALRPVPTSEGRPMSHTTTFFEQAAEITRQIDHAAIEALASALVTLRERGGRLFILGVGGSAANCSHA